MRTEWNESRDELGPYYKKKTGGKESKVYPAER